MSTLAAIIAVTAVTAIWDQLAHAAFWESLPRVIAPIVLAAQGGALCHRAGVFNVALEGMMLCGAFAAVAVSFALGSAAAGVLAAVLASTMLALVFATASVWRRGDPIVVGIALNILASGLTAFGLRSAFGVGGSFDHPDIVALPRFDLPLLADIPGLGPLFANQTVLVWSAVAATVLMQLILFHHRFGLRLRGVGEHPEAARSAGISPVRVQTAALCMCGVLCGLAGAQLAIGAVSLFVEDMTAGRGWIAVVAVLLAAGHPLAVAAIAVLFGVIDSVSVRIQGLGAPQQLTEMLPYLGTLAALIIAAMRRQRRRRSSIDRAASDQATNHPTSRS